MEYEDELNFVRTQIKVLQRSVSTLRQREAELRMLIRKRDLGEPQVVAGPRTLEEATLRQANNGCEGCGG